MLNKTVKLQAAIQGVWALFLLTFPFSLRWIFWEEASYRFGTFNPWVTGFFYAPELFLWIVFLFYFFSVKRSFFTLHNRIWILFFVVNLVGISFWQGHGILGLILLGRLLEAGMVYVLIRDEFLPHKTVVSLLLGSLIFQVTLGATQVILNGSLGLPWIGESQIGASVKGVAKLDLAEGFKQVRAYGTFLHPNLLAGFVLALLLSLWKSVHFKSHVALMVFGVSGVLLSHSRAAMAVLLGVVILDFILRGVSESIRKIIEHFLIAGLVLGNLILFLGAGQFGFQDPSFQERAMQIEASQSLVAARPLGVGASGFTLAMEQAASEKLKPWEFQPVHNVYFLILTELGVQGLVLFLVLLGLAWISLRPQFIPFFAVLALASFDHFWWDSFAGIMTLAVCLPLITPHHRKEPLN